MNELINLGILGPGNIASTITKELDEVEGLNKYAVASRSMKRAKGFSQKFSFEKAYGSYLDMLSDPKLDLVYIATPHAFHYKQMMLALEHGKMIFCEKAFTLNYLDAKKVIDKARSKGIFVSEAMVTAYLPSTNKLKELIDAKIIGNVICYKGVFGNELMHVERVVNKSLGGGALYDIGIYPLYFCLALFGFNPVIKKVDMKMYNDIDESEDILLEYENGIKAEINVSIKDFYGYYCDIIGTKGRIHIETFGMPKVIEVYDNHDNLINKFNFPDNTYKHEFKACVDAINTGQIETEAMPHKDTLKLLEYIDNIYSFNK